jgi:hypothetical protein
MKQKEESCKVRTELNFKGAKDEPNLHGAMMTRPPGRGILAGVMTVNLVVASSHLEALTEAARKSKLTLQGYLAEVVESHCATLILPTVRSGGQPGGIVRDERSEEGNLPTYRVHL